MSSKKSNDTEEDSTDFSTYSSSSNDEKINTIDPETDFNVKELCYYKKINDFYKVCSNENIEKMMSIIDGKSTISLRILDWFVTKYSKKKIDCGLNNNDESFDVRISYKSQLKSYKKKYFDPFRRRTRFVYKFNKNTDKTMITTLGQLNFFKWAFSNNILVYVEKNLKYISKEMNSSNKEDKKKKIDKKKDKDSLGSDTKKIKNEKVENIKINATKVTNNENIEIILKFD